MRLIEFRAAENLTQDELAARLGFELNDVIRLESGEHNLDEATIEKLRRLDVDVCPGCGTDLRDGEIPEQDRDRFYGGRRYWSRRIGVEIPGVYDGILFYRCPDCGHEWSRFPPEDTIRRRYQRWLERKQAGAGR